MVELSLREVGGSNPPRSGMRKTIWLQWRTSFCFGNLREGKRKIVSGEAVMTINYVT
ncbi:hypothetical protein YC2023_088216 [Brassica napus]